MWNVLSLYRSGALQNLIEVMQEYKIDLLAVQEVRWLGRSIIEKTAQYTRAVMMKKYFWNRLYC
jgi:uncharacterized protein YbgA (DUF1722 family)